MGLVNNRDHRLRSSCLCMFNVFRAYYTVVVVTGYSQAIFFPIAKDYERGLRTVIRVVRAGGVLIRGEMLWLG